MNKSSAKASQPKVSVANLRRALADRTRWKILDLLLQRGPLTNEIIVGAVRSSKQSVSQHLVFMRKAGILEHRLGRLNAIPDAFLVPGERTIDFGPVVIRFDRAGEQ